MTQTDTRRKAISGSAIRAFLIGGVLGLDSVSYHIAMAALIFSGPLAGYLGLGSGLFLLAAAFSTLVLVWRSAIPAAVSNVQDAALAVLAPAVAIAVVQVSSPEAALATALAILGLTAVTTGAVLLSMAKLKADRLARVMPFSVAAGFLAASGWLLVSAALVLAAEVSSVWQLAEIASDPDSQRNLALTVAFGLSLWVLSHFFGISAILALIALGFFLFYGILSQLGMSVEDARTVGDLPSIAADGFAELPDPGLVRLIDWTALGGALPLVAAAVTVNIIGFFLNITGVELGARRDVDIAHEMNVTGSANIAVGVFGSGGVFLASGVTLLASRLRLQSRAVGIAVGAICFLAFFFANAFIPYVPHFLTNGFILFIGLTMLEDWLFRTRKRLDRTEWLVVLAIVLTTAIAGMIPAILLGIALAVVKFVVAYARLPVIRRAAPLTAWASSVDRSKTARAVLAEEGKSVFVIELAGYIFFGSAEQILDTVRARLKDAPRLRICVLDFAGVTGLDSATYAAFEKLGQVVQAARAEVILASLAPEDASGLERWGLDLAGGTPFRLAPSRDAALTAIEDRIAGAESTDEGDPVELFLPHEMPEDARALFARTERLDLRPTQLVIEAGASDRDIFFVLSGRLSVFITTDNGQRLRVRSMLRGTIVGEVARYLGGPRTADVSADVPSVVLALREAEIDRLERDAPALSALLHRLVARNLAETVAKTNRVLSARGG